MIGLSKLFCFSMIAIAVATAANANPDGPTTAPSSENVVTVPTEKAAYLGVTASLATLALRDQLQLPRGVGLLIDYVEPDSPANASGLQKFDVIQKFDDQILISLYQLNVLLRLHNCGDQITLSVIRSGKPLEIKVKLIEKEVPTLESLVPTTLLNLMTPAKHLFPQDGSHLKCALTQTDDQHVVTISLTDEGKEVTVKSRDGLLIFSSTLNQPDDFNKIPDNLRAKIDKAIKTLQRMTENPRTPPITPPQTEDDQKQKL